MRKIIMLFVLILALTLPASGCTSWNTGMTAANTYTSTQITAQQANVQGVHDNTARAWVASGCGISYGELVRNGSGNNALAKAVVALCGAPSGMAVLETSDSGVNKILVADGYVKVTATTATTNATAAQ